MKRIELYYAPEKLLVFYIIFNTLKFLARLVITLLHINSAVP